MKYLRTCIGGFLSVMLLVGLAHATTYTVTSTTDSGASLRAAIIAANADNSASAGSPHHIVFAIPGAGVHTITPTAQFPFITRPVVIDGFSQVGSSANTLTDAAIYVFPDPEADEPNAALFSNDDALANDWLDAGTRHFDPLWRMPLHRPYLRYLSSGIADLANSGATTSDNANINPMLAPTSAMDLVRTWSRVWSASKAVTAADTAPAPCKARPMVSQIRLGAQAAIKLPTANTSSPKMITRFRPRRSEAIPNGNCKQACVKP